VRAWLQRLLVIAVLGVLGLLTLWMQFGIIEQKGAQVLRARERHDPDYYIEKFNAVGLDANGNRQYTLEATRAVHYPDDGTSLLDNPHLVEFLPGEAPRHTYAESGWVSADGNEVLLTGKVRVVQGAAGKSAGSTMRTEKLKVQLNRRAAQKAAGKGENG
jgi:lipopolysaccharide export system protein LptC